MASSTLQHRSDKSVSMSSWTDKMYYQKKCFFFPNCSKAEQQEEETAYTAGPWVPIIFCAPLDTDLVVE